MPVTGIKDEIDRVDPVDGLGGERRRVDRTIPKAEKLESDPNAHGVGAIAGQFERVAGSGDGFARGKSRGPGWDREQVGRAKVSTNTQSRPQIRVHTLSIHPAVGPHGEGHPSQGEDVVGASGLGGGAGLGGVGQQPLAPRLDAGVAGGAGDLQDPLGGRRHHGGAVQIDGGGHFSRITPKVRPATMYFRATTISTSGTDIAITPAAAIWFQMIANWVTKPCTPTGNVWAFGVAVRIRANRNSLQAKVKTMMPAAMMPGAASGSSTRRNAVQRLAPSTSATSSTSSGISARNPLSIQIANGRLKSE